MTWEAAIKNALDNPEIEWPADVDPAILRKGKRNKFNAVRCDFDGMKFDSKAELKRYGDLRLMELQGDITDLSHHPVLPLHAGVKYEADFRYTERGRVIVEDVKGGKATATALFKVKWKQAIELYPDIEFRIVTK